MSISDAGSTIERRLGFDHLMKTVPPRSWWYPRSGRIRCEQSLLQIGHPALASLYFYERILIFM
jgi:hypothetical protein